MKYTTLRLKTKFDTIYAGTTWITDGCFMLNRDSIKPGSAAIAKKLLNYPLYGSAQDELLNARKGELAHMDKALAECVNRFYANKRTNRRLHQESSTVWAYKGKYHKEIRLTAFSMTDSIGLVWLDSDKLNLIYRLTEFDSIYGSPAQPIAFFKGGRLAAILMPYSGFSTFQDAAREGIQNSGEVFNLRNTWQAAFPPDNAHTFSNEPIRTNFSKAV